MILQIVGMKNSGKTTLMNHAISFLKERGYSVAKIKHHGHIGEEIELQSSDVDHMKHFAAGADQSIVQGHHLQQTVTRKKKQSLREIIENSVTIDCSIILVEGFKEANYDKIIVYKNNDELRSLQGLSHVIGKIETNHPRANNQLEHLLNKLIKDKGMN